MSISESDQKHVIGLAETKWVERHKDTMIIPFSTSVSYSLLSLFATKVFMKISMNILNVKSRKHGLRKLSPEHKVCTQFVVDFIV